MDKIKQDLENLSYACMDDYECGNTMEKIDLILNIIDGTNGDHDICCRYAINKMKNIIREG